MVTRKAFAPSVRHRYVLVAGNFSLCAMAAATFILSHDEVNRLPASEPMSASLSSVMAAASASPIANPPAYHGSKSSGPAAATASATRIIVARNDTLDGIFKKLAFDKADLSAIRRLPGVRQSLDCLKPGDVIVVTRSPVGAFEGLTREISDTQTLQVVRHDDGFVAQIIVNPVETRLRTATATIDTSLFEAAAAANVSDTVALKLANVFAWDIDFALDIREGDRFTAVYEQIYRDGSYLRDGEVLAAEFVNDGKTYRALRFTPPDGSSGYYTPDGKPMRKAFLRAPLDFTRVSSVFDPARMHPILNTIRGHMGTDYAAPSGTPVRAAGEGRVSFKGTRGGYGNAIVLDHSNGVSTLYGHMSHFAARVRAGSHVNQGEIIGYVGMTGLATGPHLHYEYLSNGVHMNPQTVRLPGAEPLHSEYMNSFRSSTAMPLQRLTSHDSPAAEPTAAAPVVSSETAASMVPFTAHPNSPAGIFSEIYLPEARSALSPQVHAADELSSPQAFATSSNE